MSKVQDQYEKETGRKWMVAPYCHGETGYASWDYQAWLEQKFEQLKAENAKLKAAMPDLGQIEIAITVLQNTEPKNENDVPIVEGVILFLSRMAAKIREVS